MVLADKLPAPKLHRRRFLRRAAVAVAGVLGLVFAVGSCQSRPNLPQLQPAKGWTVSVDAPAIPAGSLRAKALWNDPCVLRLPDGRYVMYATTSVDEPFKPPILPFRLISRDGRNWQLSPGQPLLRAQGGFTSVETPSVVQFGGKWHMFFTGTLPEGSKSPMAIGHALSDDGVSWRFDPGVRIAATGNFADWNGFLVGEPGAVVVNGRLRVYFSAVGARASGNPPQLQSIGMIESADGVRFSAPRQALVPTARYPGSAGYAGYSSPAAVMNGPDLHLFYSLAWFQKGANPEWNQIGIAEAVSAGGTAPFAETAAPVLSLRSTRWATGEILAPGPLVEDGKLSLWFGGHLPVQDLGPLVRADFKGPGFGIGYASLPLPRPSATPAAAIRRNTP